MNRRTFLTAMGLSGSSLYLTSLLPGRRAYGQAPAAPPQRIVFVFTNHGTVYDNWKMRPGGMTETVDAEFSLASMSEAEFSEALRPLHAHRDRLLVLDGLTEVTCYTDPSPGDHEKGQTSCMTGAHTTLVGGVPLANGPSVDQIIAGALARPDRHRSIEAAISPWPLPINYTGPAQGLLATEQPAEMWDRLFGLSQGESLDDNRNIVGRQKSALDALQTQYRQLSDKLSADDKQKLEQHQQLIRELEQRFSGLAGLECPAVERPEDAIEDYSTMVGLHVQLMTAGLSCDVMRVATLILGDMPNELFGLEDSDHFHVKYAHAVHAPTSHGERFRQLMTSYTARHATQLGELMDALAAVPEAGGTLLDNTTIVWLGELGNGAHGFDPWPVVIAGGTNSPFRMGRYVRWAPTTPAPTRPWPTGLHAPAYTHQTTGVPHQKLLVSLAQGFGVDTDTVGLAETRAADGSTINLRGPLDRLAR